MAAVRAFPLAATGPVGPAALTNAVQGVPAQNTIVKLLGWSLVETGGTSKATMTITDATGRIVGIASAPTGTAATPVWFGPEGVECTGQLTATFSGGGTPSAVIYIR